MEQEPLKVHSHLSESYHELTQYGHESEVDAWNTLSEMCSGLSADFMLARQATSWRSKFKRPHIWWAWAGNVFIHVFLLLLLFSFYLTLHRNVSSGKFAETFFLGIFFQPILSVLFVVMCQQTVPMLRKAHFYCLHGETAKAQHRREAVKANEWQRNTFVEKPKFGIPDQGPRRVRHTNSSVALQHKTSAAAAQTLPAGWRVVRRYCVLPY